MITLKQWMDTCGYRITEGSDYGWNCYGSDAYCLDSWNGDHDGHTMSITFDTKTQEVYEAYVCDFQNQRAYRLINPEYKQAHDLEVKDREIDDEAWDCVKFVDLDTEEDFLEKATAIVNGEKYDTRVQVPLTLPDDVLFELMKRAHEQDITLNQLVEQVLWEAIRAEEGRKESFDREGVLDSQYPDGDGYWRDQEMRDEYDFSEGVRTNPAKMKVKKKKKQ